MRRNEVKRNEVKRNEVDSDKEESGGKPSWLLTAQKIYPMRDDEYYKLLEAARRSAKINLNLRNAFTAPAYQKRYIKNMGESLVIDAAIAFRHCKSVLQR